MLRVLTFGRFADADFGGLERYVFDLGQGLRGEVEFVNIVAARGRPPDVKVAGEVVYARSLIELGGVPICPAMPWRANRLHRQAAFDIVHLQFPPDPMAHAATMLLPRRVRRVITWHSDIVRQRNLLRLYRPFLDRLVHSADAIIFPTPAHHSSSQQLGAVTNLSRLHVVPFGTDLTRFQRPAQGVEAIRARGKGRKVIFALGRHVYYKGFEFLIRALREVPQVHLLLGGRGPLTDELARLVAKLGLADRCEFLGRIPEDALPAHYQACDVFCMPSVERAEAFGFVQLEAMAAGKPVVCCELRNGVTYVNRHGETGLVVPPADPDALAAALRRLSLDDDFRERLGRQARERALREFTLEAMARGTLRVYRNVLEAA